MIVALGNRRVHFRNLLPKIAIGGYLILTLLRMIHLNIAFQHRKGRLPG